MHRSIRLLSFAFALTIGSVIGMPTESTAQVLQCQIGPGGYRNCQPRPQNVERRAPHNQRYYYRSQPPRHFAPPRQQRPRYVHGGGMQQRSAYSSGGGYSTSRRVSIRSGSMRQGGSGVRPIDRAYTPPPVADVRGGVKYTGRACQRAEGTVGAEGYGPGGQLGCWKF